MVALPSQPRSTVLCHRTLVNVTTTIITSISIARRTSTFYKDFLQRYFQENNIQLLKVVGFLIQKIYFVFSIVQIDTIFSVK